MRKILDYTTPHCADVMTYVNKGFRPFGSAFFDAELDYAVQPMILYAPELSTAEAAAIIQKNKESKRPGYVDLDNGTRVHLLADDPKAPGPYDGRMSSWDADDEGPGFIPNEYEARATTGYTTEECYRIFKNGEPMIGTYPSSTQASRVTIEIREAYEEGVEHGRAYQGAIYDVYGDGS